MFLAFNHILSLLTRVFLQQISLVIFDLTDVMSFYEPGLMQVTLD